MTIRPERPAEFPAIYELVKDAFATAPHADGDEQDYVNTLRETERYLPALALVAEDAEGTLIGHIMLTETKLTHAGGGLTGLLLSPLCVALPQRRAGLGAALVKESFRLAKGDYSAVFVVGDPAYYARFGFRPASEFGIANEGDIPPQYVMACELIPDALRGKSGTIRVI